MSDFDSLKESLYRAVEENVMEKDVAVAFSGGVDSTLLARICHDIGKGVTLLTIGFPSSHDLLFSNIIARKISLPHRILEIREKDFETNLAHIRKKIGCSNTSHIENCIAYHYIAKLAKENSVTTVLSANGCDELFCGYNGYRLVYDKGQGAIMEFMNQKIENEFVLMKEISEVTDEFGIKVIQPFLTDKFISFAKTIPLDKKIKGADDLIRKHILREVALQIQVPEESAMKPKKALQYGSQIHKHFKGLQNTRG